MVHWLDREHDGRWSGKALRIRLRAPLGIVLVKSVADQQPVVIYVAPAGGANRIKRFAAM